ncbi:hypothetical protein G6F68_011084 [Rhizopus microsporus]|nr:hypothetical protein G6F68_011084 [Rhizopus microsporus]
MMQRIERPECLDQLAMRRERAACIRQHRVVHRTMGDTDRLAAGAEQIDDGRAAKSHVVRAQLLQHHRVAPVLALGVQYQVKGEASAGTLRHRRQVQVDKAEFLGIGEQFGQQPIGRVRARRKVDQGLIVGESDRAQRHAVQAPPASVAIGFDVGRLDAKHQGIAQRSPYRGLAIEEQAQAIGAQLVKTQLIGQQLEAHRDLATGSGRQGRRHWRIGDAAIHHLLHADRRQHHIVGRTEIAGHAPDRTALDGGSTRHAYRRAQFGGHPFGIEMGDRAGGERPQIVRIEHIQQCVGELGIVVLDALGYARTEQREGLDQALDMRVLAALGGELQATGDLR